MHVKEMGLAWIVVQDFKKAIQFYTEVVGLKLCEVQEEYGWAELSGQDGGFRLGIAQKNEQEGIAPGQNSILTLTVENLDGALNELREKKTRLIGNVMEVPGQVKMQMIQDEDGNHFQLVELLKG